MPDHQEALDHNTPVVCELQEKTMQRRSWGNGALCKSCEQLGHVAGLLGLPARLPCALHTERRIALAISH